MQKEITDALNQLSAMSVKEPVTKDVIYKLFDLKKQFLDVEELKHGKRIIDNNESNSYSKLQKLLLSK